jgi:hypothetical protein
LRGKREPRRHPEQPLRLRDWKERDRHPLTMFKLPLSVGAVRQRSSVGNDGANVWNDAETPGPRRGSLPPLLKAAVWRVAAGLGRFRTLP